MASRIIGKQMNKLWINGLHQNLTNEEVENFCKEFGAFVSMNRTNDKLHVFLTYSSDENAAEALHKFRIKRVKSNYANTRQNHSNQLQPTPNNLNRSPYLRENGFSFQDDHTSSTSKIAQKPIFRNGCEIVITHVTDKLEFYAHLKSQHEDYIYLIDTVDRLAKLADPLNEIPRICSLVFAPHDGRFWRSIVHKTLDAIVTVELIDSGVILKIPYNQLKRIHKEFHDYEIGITFSFLLSGINEDEISSYALNYFKSLLGTTLKMESNSLIVKPGSKVTLTDPMDKQMINLFVKRFNKSYSTDLLVRIDPPIGRDQVLILVDDSRLKDNFNLITFIQKIHYHEFCSQARLFNEFGKKYEKYAAYNPNEEEVILVKLKNDWHRGAFYGLSESDAGKAIVFLLDHHKAIEVDLENVRKIINEDLINTQILSFTLAAEDFNRIGIQELVKKVNEPEIICEVRWSVIENRGFIKF